MFLRTRSTIENKFNQCNSEVRISYFFKVSETKYIIEGK